MSDHYYAQPGPIKPVGLPGHKLAIWAAAKWSCYKIVFLEPLPLSADLVFDMGPITALASSGDIALTNLVLTIEPPEMVQIRCYVLDDIEATVKRGAADVRFKTKAIIAKVTRFTIQIDPCLHTTELIALKGDEPYINAKNPTDYNLAQSRVGYFGFRFGLEDLKLKFTKVEEVEKALAPITLVAAGGY